MSTLTAFMHRLSEMKPSVLVFEISNVDKAYLNFATEGNLTIIMEQPQSNIPTLAKLDFICPLRKTL